MPQTLLLRMPAADTQPCEWLAVDAHGLATGPRRSGTLQAAAAEAAGHRVVVLVPATQVLLADPELPPGGGARILRAIPFALEEQLTEDIDTLFFAVGRRTARGTTAVAVVARQVMQDWMSALSQAGVAPAAVYADAALLPDNPSQTVLWIDGDRLAWRRPGMQAVTIDMTSVSDALSVAGLANSPADPGAVREPENVLLYLGEADWQRVQQEFERLHGQFASLNVQLLADGPLPWFARELAATQAVNLLQGEFAVASDYRAHWLAWRTAALLAAGLLLAHIGVQALEIRQANREAAATGAQIAEVFASAMPSEQLHDARRQMQARLDRIRKAGGGPEYFLRMTQALSAAGAAAPGVGIEAMNFHDQALELKVTAPSVDALSALAKGVTQQGYAAEIQSSTPAGDHVEARLQLRAGRVAGK